MLEKLAGTGALLPRGDAVIDEVPQLGVGHLFQRLRAYALHGIQQASVTDGPHVNRRPTCNIAACMYYFTAEGLLLSLPIARRNLSFILAVPACVLCYAGIWASISAQFWLMIEMTSTACCCCQRTTSTKDKQGEQGLKKDGQRP